MTARATYDFSGATALVTGGTSGIGHAIVTKLRDAGAAVTTTGRKPQATDYGIDLDGITYHQLELTDRTGIQGLAAEFSTLDILVNNAGAIFAGGMDESTPDGFRATVDLNLFGPFELTTALHGALAGSTSPGGASVVGLSSLSTVRAVPMVPAYGAAKSGVLAMTRNFAMKWGPDKIRVNAVTAGFIDTPMTSPELVPDYIAEQVARTPLGRLGNPEDVADAVIFLCTDNSSFITGSVVTVDGGYCVS
ncbi:SDR family NAD(P)-dependent oxidoreductase [Mycolicibacterium diernhoferi]|uniref:NAD(P)-dependent oxidoreductase n=1 Tax=Mycolicibacterium diernhoferi TaxID=1801 RepID=A0A1Q4HFX5_9MYCO|nr:SDR family oxidoreductase [Mycolicibacterium diernhoferi]OJZ66426.1 oxidoreductase [Mycolicibacterium diernhoferi]PEG56301.1 NAD(P)-dependent oxidoreductase [Mycolicibacterium diernhoferi]QYL24599.1 SDR family oxidoreductase [Mycolicibacterium diernhoferi]